jgi:hypothetical protein
LVEQGLEQVVVRAVDDRDLDGSPTQGPGREQATEAGADDDNPVLHGRVVNSAAGIVRPTV